MAVRCGTTTAGDRAPVDCWAFRAQGSRSCRRVVHTAVVFSGSTCTAAANLLVASLRRSVTVAETHDPMAPPPPDDRKGRRKRKNGDVPGRPAGNGHTDRGGDD